MLNKKKKGLGKGIGSLIDDYSFDAVFQNSIGIGKKVETLDPELLDKVIELNIECVHPNINQPRKSFDAETLKELSESIKSLGVLQPLLVRKISNSNYSIIAGERRYRASKLAGLKTVPCLIKTFDDIQRLEVALIENIQRENLNPIDEAKAYAYLLDKSGLKQEDLATRVGKNRSTITNSLRLLKLSADMQEALLDGQLTAGHARALLSVKNPSEQNLLFDKIIKENLSVRAAEAQASRYNKGIRGAAIPKKVSVSLDDNDAKADKANMKYIQTKFSNKSGMKVKAKGTPQEGKIQINYTSYDELEKLFQMLSGGERLFELSKD